MIHEKVEISIKTYIVVQHNLFVRKFFFNMLMCKKVKTNKLIIHSNYLHDNSDKKESSIK